MPLKFQDYYATLGVPRSAAADEIKRAYRKLALEWHPDRHPPEKRAEVEQRFKRIAEAYEVLSDADKRKRYDALGEHWRDGQDFTPPPGGGFRQMDPDEFARMFGGGGGGFSDFFARMFGDQFARNFGGGAGGFGGGRAAPRREGADVEATLGLSVGDALAGGRRTFRVPASIPCERCGGAGHVGRHVCPTCAGVGHLRTEKTVDLAIPADVRSGQVLRLRGLGEPGDDGGPPGDLLLRVELHDDDTYRLRDGTVEAALPLAPWEAEFGTRVDVRLRDKTLAVTVPAGTHAGQKLRLRGQGLADGRGGRGDVVLVIRLVLPEGMDDRQRELLRELAQGAGPVRGGVRA